MNVEQQLNALRFHGMERQWKSMKETRQTGETGNGRRPCPFAADRI